MQNSMPFELQTWRADGTVDREGFLYIDAARDAHRAALARPAVVRARVVEHVIEYTGNRERVIADAAPGQVTSDDGTVLPKPVSAVTAGLKIWCAQHRETQRKIREEESAHDGPSKRVKDWPKRVREATS